uniref:Uncharacterized protein n=1 Tax=Plectus sambesii TaxID=2011161 RepID=A0A914V9Q7_9BILA
MIAIFLATGMTIYQVHDRTNYYMSTPIAFDVTEVDGLNQTMPAIVICPAGQFRASLVGRRVVESIVDDIRISRAADLLAIEQHRDKMIAFFHLNNITFSNNFFNTTIYEVRKIAQTIEEAINAGRLLNRSTWEKLEIVSDSLKKLFPIMASRLTIEPPLRNGRIDLPSSDFSLDQAGAFSKFRDLNAAYDSCSRRYSSTGFEANIDKIIYCRIMDKTENIHTYTYLDTLSVGAFFELYYTIYIYPRIVNLGRTTLQDTIIDCKWFGKACLVTEVWTPQKKCFRIVPNDTNDALITMTDKDGSVNILIDTLTHEFTPARPRQDEDEFAQTNGGIPIKPGTISDMIINQKRINILASKNCGTKTLNLFQRYSKDKCIWEERTREILSKCNCLSDLLPNYLKDAAEEVKKMMADDSYIPCNMTYNFCSLPEALFCTPDAIMNDFNCPDDCQKESYEVDLTNSNIDAKTVFERLPKGFNRKIDIEIVRKTDYGTLRTAPGSIQLNALLDQFLTNHMNMIKAFWWQTDVNGNTSEPYYLPWFQDFGSFSSSATFEDSNQGTYWKDATQTEANFCELKNFKAELQLVGGIPYFFVKINFLFFLSDG